MPRRAEGQRHEDPRTHGTRSDSRHRLRRWTRLRSAERERTDGVAERRTPPPRMPRTHKWWEQFGDPVLDELIESALRENLDLAHRRRARRPVPRRADRPRARSSIRSSATARDASRTRAEPRRPAAAAAGRRSVLHAVPGRARRVVADRSVRPRAPPDRGRAGAGLRERAGRRGVVLSVVTSVAASYIALRALDRQLEIAQATAKNFGDTAAHLRPAPQGRRRVAGPSSRRSSRSTSRRSPPFRRSSSRSRRRRT